MELTSVHFFFEGVVESVEAWLLDIVTLWWLLALVKHLPVLHMLSTHRLNKRRLIHVNPMLHLQLLRIRYQKALIPRQFVTNRFQRHFINSHVDLECVHSHKKLFGYVENIP